MTSRETYPTLAKVERIGTGQQVVAELTIALDEIDRLRELNDLANRIIESN